MPSLALPEKVSQQSSRKLNQRIIKSDYGDGYEQRAAWGLDSKFDEWNLEWQHLSTSQRDTWMQFYNEVGLVKSWDWTPPGETETKKFVFTEAPQETNHGWYSSINASAKEVFE